MKKECEWTRRVLPKYLRGHLFKMTERRIERHLEQCVVCRSEFEALRRTEETRQILNDVNAPDGILGRIKEAVSSVRKLKKILYRPLWMTGIVLLAAALYYYIVTPRQLDLEIERIVKTEPSTSVHVASAPAVTTTLTLTASSKVGQPSPARTAAARPVTEPLVVTITADDDTSVMRRINEIMHEHGQLQKLKFSDSVREISGSLLSKELRVFFGRVGSVAKVSYSRKRFESYPAAEPIPFIMKLTYAPPRPSAQPAPSSAEAPAGREIPAAPMKSPHERAEAGSHTTGPAQSQPVTAPSQTASQ